MSDEDEAILRMLAGRMTDGEIAFALHISTQELSTRMARLFQEIDAADRENAVAIAMERGIIEI